MPAFMTSAKPTATAAATTSKLAPSKPPTNPPPTDKSSTAASLTRQSLNVLHQFLSYVDPESASLLPIPTTTTTSSSNASIPSVQPQIPIAEWNVLYTTTSPPTTVGGFASSITVRSHPDPNRYLFSVQSTLPGVTARQFWSLMASAENRKLWDNTVEEGAVKRWLAAEPRSPPAHAHEAVKSSELARAMAARVELLRFGSIFMVAKARDMVLLSVDARLPSKAKAGAAPLRLVSTSQSVVHPSLPPRKGYTRFELKTGGFMVEDLGDDGGIPDTTAAAAASGTVQLGKSPSSATSAKGSHFRLGLLGLGGGGRHHVRSNSNSSSSSASRDAAPTQNRDPRGAAVLITQVSDLGEMAAWVPASVIKMVASTLVPSSIASVAKVAKTMAVSPALFQEFDATQKPEEAKLAEPLGMQQGACWYSHRTLPAMVGQGFLSKSRPPKATAAVDVEKTTTTTTTITTNPVEVAGPSARLCHVSESVATPFMPKVRDSVASPKLGGDKSLHCTPSEAAAGATCISTAIPTPVAAHVTSALPPRTSSLTSTPAANSASSRPAMLLDLCSLSPPTFPDRLLHCRTASAALPASPGMATTTDSELAQDDAMSSSLTSAGSSTRVRSRRMPIAMTPSEGTETVPGSVAASEMDEGLAGKEGEGDYLNKGKQGHVYYAAAKFTRATLHLANTDAEHVEYIDEHVAGVGVAEKRSRLLSNELFDAYVDSEMRSSGAGSGKITTTTNGGAVSALDKRMRRLSSALYAELSRRQRSAEGGFSPSSFKSSTKALPETQVEVKAKEEEEEGKRSELVALLADALAESIPFMAHASVDEVKEQARRVSAMVLVGSDALALSLAPGARESLGLQLDALSTPPSEASVSVSIAPSCDADHPASPVGDEMGRCDKKKQMGRRNRKVSVNAKSRSISVSRASAQVKANTESVISIESLPSSSFSTSPLSSSCTTGATTTALTPTNATSKDRKAVSTLRQLDRNRHSSSTTSGHGYGYAAYGFGYGARLFSGLAYYSGYSNPKQGESESGVVVVRTSMPSAAAHSSIGRKRTRANYRLENNAKLHPFPAAQAGSNGVDRATTTTTHQPRGGGGGQLPPPITGFGVGRMHRFPVPSDPIDAGQDDSWEDDDDDGRGGAENMNLAC